MSDLALIDAVAKKTGEDSHEIRHRGFVLTSHEAPGPDLDPECLLEVLLVDLPETGTVDWDSLGGLTSLSDKAAAPPRAKPDVGLPHRFKRWPTARCSRENGAPRNRTGTRRKTLVPRATA